MPNSDSEGWKTSKKCYPPPTNFNESSSQPYITRSSCLLSARLCQNVIYLLKYSKEQVWVVKILIHQRRCPCTFWCQLELTSLNSLSDIIVHRTLSSLQLLGKMAPCYTVISEGLDSIPMTIFNQCALHLVMWCHMVAKLLIKCQYIRQNVKNSIFLYRLSNSD